MAVAFDAVGPSSSGQTGTASPVSWTHAAVASGVAVLVGIGYGHASGADGTLAVTCDGAGMTLLGKVDNDNGTAGLTALYGIANQASGNHTISVSVTGGAGSLTLECGSVSYSGAATTVGAAFGTAVTAFGDTSVSGTEAVTVTGTTAGNVVGAVSSIGTGALANPATSRWLANFSNSNGAGNAGQADKAAGGSVTFTWTSGGTDFWGAVGVEIKAAGAGPSSGPLFRQAVQAVRARMPQQPVLRGRCSSSPGAPVRNPAPGPVFRPKPAPVRYALPPWQPRAGRIGSSSGAPVINPLRGPPARPLPGPVQALPRLLPRAGRAASRAGVPFSGALNPVPAGSTSGQNTAGGTSITVTLPSYSTGDFILLVISNNQSQASLAFSAAISAATPLPAGGADGRVWAFRLVPNGPGQTTFTVTGGTAAVWSWWCANYRGASTALPVVSSTDATGNSTSSAIAMPEVGAGYIATGRELLISAAGVNSTATWTTDAYTQFHTTANNAALMVDAVNLAAGSLTGVPVRMDRGNNGSTRNQNSLALILQAAPGGIANLLSNPSFETGSPIATGWTDEHTTATQATYSIVSSGVTDGTVAQKFTYTGVPADGGTAKTELFQAPVPASPGQYLTFSVCLSGSFVNAYAFIGVEAFTSAGVYISESDLTVLSLSSTPVQYSVIYQCPPGTDHVAAYIQCPEIGATSVLSVTMDQAELTAVAPGVSQGAPVRARTAVLPGRGRVYAAPQPAGTVIPPVSSGPPFSPAVQAVRIRPALPPRGRVASGPGVPAQNPSSGPAFRQATSPARARVPLFRLGRAAANPGAQVRNPSPGPQAYPAQGPARARLPQLAPRAGRVTSNPGVPAQNPSAGPAFTPAPRPARAPVPQSFSKGRTASSPGSTPRNPHQGPVFEQAVTPARAVIPQTFSKGRTSGNPGAPVANPVHGPAFRQATAPVRIRPSLPPRGRTASNPGGPVQNPIPGVVGPPFYPFRSPARSRITLPPRGRTSSGAGIPARNPHQGAAFPAWHGPAQARQPLPPHGRITSNPGGPVVNPPAHGPVIPQAGQPARARFPLPLRGRIASGTGAPLVTSGPRFAPFAQPVRARLPLSPRGRTGSNPGTPAVVQPVFTGPRFTPRHDPARIRPSLPPRGRVSANPGVPARNPRRGPVFTPLDWPCRARIPQNAPKGRTSGNPGGPVANIPSGNPLFRLGTPYFQWQSGTPVFAWAAGTPQTSA